MRRVGPPVKVWLAFAPFLVVSQPTSASPDRRPAPYDLEQRPADRLCGVSPSLSTLPSNRGCVGWAGPRLCCKRVRLVLVAWPDVAVRALRRRQAIRVATSGQQWLTVIRMPTLAEPRRWLRADPRGTLSLLVQTDVDVEPPVLTRLVDFAFADEEARIEPAVWLRFGG